MLFADLSANMSKAVNTATELMNEAMKCNVELGIMAEGIISRTTDEATAATDRLATLKSGMSQLLDN